MIVELLHIADCPNTAIAAERLRAALDASGMHDTPIQQTEVTEENVATVHGFSGSPTILLDGRDIVAAERATEVACRVYATPAGLAGAPTVEQLIQALSER